MKRRLPVTVVLIALLVVAGMATWLLRDLLARSVSNHLLDGTGLRVTVLDGFQPSLRGTDVGELVVELTASGRIQRLHDIEVDYSLSGLLGGQLRALRIGRAELDTAAGTASTGPAAEAPPLTGISGMLRQAPLGSVHIDDLRLNGRPMTLALRWQDERLTGRLGDGETSLHLDVDWQIEGTDSASPLPAEAAPFEIRLAAQTGSQPALELTLDVVPRNGMLHLQAATHIDSDTARPVITAVAALLSLPTPDQLVPSGSAGVTVQARLPDALAFPQTLHLTARIGAGGRVVVPAAWFPSVGAAAVEAHWDEPVTLTLDRPGSGAEPEFTLTGHHMAMAVPELDTGTARVTHAALTLTAYRLHCRAPATCEFSATTGVQAESVTLILPDDTGAGESIHLSGPALTIPTLDGSLADDVLSLQASAGTHFSLPEAGLGALSARDSAAALPAAARLRIPLADREGLHLQADELSLDLPLLRNGDHMAGLQLRLRRLDTRPLGPFMLDAEVRLSNAYTNLFSLNLWDATLTADITVDDGIAGFEASAALNGQTAVLMSGEHDLAASSGQGTVEVPDVTFNESGNSLSDFISPLPVPVDLVSGTFSGQADLKWQLPEEEAVPVLTGKVDFELADIAGFYDSIGFIGLDTRLHARLEEGGHLLSETEERLRIARLDVGFPIEDIETSYRIDTAGPSIRMREAQMALFGGRITADSLDYDASAESSTSTLILEGIDIARILSLSAYEGITATGTVSGEIPLTLRGTQLTVNDGTITALPPGGTISYRGGSTDTGNNNLDLVYSALRNYRYSQLEADVDYMADGELLLSVRMEGVAPAIDDQRINLNVTIQDNIPSLLQSLQAGRDIAESIRVQAGAGE